MSVVVTHDFYQEYTTEKQGLKAFSIDPKEVYVIVKYIAKPKL